MWNFLEGVEKPTKRPRTDDRGGAAQAAPAEAPDPEELAARAEATKAKELKANAAKAQKIEKQKRRRAEGLRWS